MHPETAEKPPKNIQILIDAGLIEFVVDAIKDGEPLYRLTTIGEDWHNRIEQGRLN